MLFDYKGTEEDELDLRKGEIVSEVTQGGDLEEGWWSGKLNGKKGVFPNNFVEPIVNAFPSVPTPSNGSGIYRTTHFKRVMKIVFHSFRVS